MRQTLTPKIFQYRLQHSTAKARTRIQSREMSMDPTNEGMVDNTNDNRHSAEKECLNKIKSLSQSIQN